MQLNRERIPSSYKSAPKPALKPTEIFRSPRGTVANILCNRQTLANHRDQRHLNSIYFQHNPLIHISPHDSIFVTNNRAVNCIPNKSISFHKHKLALGPLENKARLVATLKTSCNNASPFHFVATVSSNHIFVITNPTKSI